MGWVTADCTHGIKFTALGNSYKCQLLGLTLKRLLSTATLSRYLKRDHKYEHIIRSGAPEFKKFENNYSSAKDMLDIKSCSPGICHLHIYPVPDDHMKFHPSLSQIPIWADLFHLESKIMHKAFLY